MLGGLFGLSFCQQGYLFSAQVLPLVGAGIGIHIFDDALLALLFLFTTYASIPSIYVRFFSKEGEMTAYYINEFRNKTQQLKAGLELLGSAFGMVLLAYGFTYFFDEQVDNMIKLPIKSNIIYLIALFSLFTIINPLLEELYWRNFLMKTYKDTEQNKMMINFTYALLHFVILSKIFNTQTAVGFSTYFYSVGRAFEYIREKHGLITCLMAHYGMTLASSLALISLIVIKIREGEIV